MTALLVLGCIALPAALLLLFVVAWRRASDDLARRVQHARRKRDLERWSNDW